MTTTRLSATLILIATSVVAACPVPVQDVAQATQIVAHLRHREMKADVHGKIIYLDISEQDKVTDDTLKAVSHLPHLKEFYAIWCPINGDGLVHFINLRELETLDLHATHIDDRALKHIAQLKTLKYLDLTATSRLGPGKFDMYGAMTDEGLTLVATLPNLETLRISGKFTDEGIKKLVELKKLQRMELNSHNVTAAGIQWLQNAMPEVAFE